MDSAIPSTIAAAVEAAAGIASSAALAARANPAHSHSGFAAPQNFAFYPCYLPPYYYPSNSNQPAQGISTHTQHSLACPAFLPNFQDHSAAQEHHEGVEDWNHAEELEEDVEEEEPQFVLSDEWAEFFARSEARRKERKELQKKNAKAAQLAAKLQAKLEKMSNPNGAPAPQI